MQSFTAFISENGRVSEKHRPYYQHWAVLYMNRAHSAGIDAASLNGFISWIGPKYVDWQVE